MINYCPECRMKLQDNFNFCPQCGINLEDKFQFCPECGKKFLPSEKTEISKPEQVEKSKPQRERKQFPFPEISLKIPSKKVLVILFAVCIVIVIAASVIVFYPLIANIGGGGSYGGRTLTITIQNTYSSDADCYITIDGLKQGAYGDVGFNVTSGETKTISVDEDDLIYQRASYPIKLFVTIDDNLREATASNVSESAEFLIYESDGQYYVNCTNSL